MRGIPRRFPSADKGGDTPAGIPEKSEKNTAQLPRKLSQERNADEWRTWNTQELNVKYV